MQKSKIQTTGLEVAGIAMMFRSMLAVVVLMAGLQSSKAQTVQSPKGAEVFTSQAIVLPPAPAKTVRVGWSYPTNFETPDLIFKVYHSTNLGLPLNKWSLLTNVGSSMRSVDFVANQAQEFFAVTASNYLGESVYASR